MSMRPGGGCPASFTAEAMGELADGTRMLVQVSVRVTEAEPEDPRRTGDGFVHGEPCPCLVMALGGMAGIIAAGGLEFVRREPS